MNNVAGEPAFENIDAILHARIIDRTKKNATSRIPAPEASVDDRVEAGTRPEKRIRAGGVAILCLVLVAGAAWFLFANRCRPGHNARR